jgi:hypothetical protein
MLPERAFQPRSKVFASGGMTLEGGESSPPPQQVTQTTSNLPEYARPYFENLLQRGQAESYRQYTPYEGERIAGFTPAQMEVQRQTMGMQTPGQFGVGTGMAGAGGLGSLAAGQQYMGMATDPYATAAFMSPFMQNVVDIQKQAAIRDAQKTQLGANLGAARQGTYGGARQLLAQTERERALGGQLGDIQARGLQSAFEQARQAQQFGAELGLRGTGQAIQAGQTLGQLGTAQQQTDLQRLAAQESVGSQQRAIEQQMLDQRYADFLRQRDYPMEQLGYYSSLLRGLPVGLSSTQTTYAAPPSMVSQVAGLGLAGYGLSQGAKTLGAKNGGLINAGLYRMERG